jgi:hypothetical protein
MADIINQLMQTTAPVPDLDNLLPQMFGDRRFIQSGRRRYQAVIDGIKVGIAIAWKPAGYANYGLNQEDMAKLLFLKQEKKFDEVFVVFATAGETYGTAEYVGHRDAAEVDKSLETIKPRQGPGGDYWLLRDDFLPLNFQPRIRGW